MILINKAIQLLNKSILNKLILSYAFIIMIPILALGYFSYTRLAEDARENFKKENIQILKSIDNNVQMYFDDFKRLTYNAYLSQEIQDILRSNNGIESVWFDNSINFKKYAVFLVGYRSDVEGVYLYTDGGHLFDESKYYGLRINDNPEYRMNSEKWFKEIQGKNGSFAVVGSHKQGYKKNKLNEYVITAAKEIRSFYTGKTSGIFFIEIKLNIFDTILKGIDTKERRVIILDENDNIIYDTEKENISLRFKDVYKGIDLKKQGSGILKNDEGREYYISTIGSPMKWKYVQFVKENNLLKQIRYMTRSIVIIGVLCFLTLLFISVYISNYIARPIKALKSSMRKVEEGDFSQSIVLHCGGEVESLAESFNTMVARIQDLILKVYETQLKDLDSQFKALQAQINPHFLYNTLESINSLVDVKRYEDIPEMIHGLANMFRYSIKKDGSNVTLEDEVNHVRLYILLQAVRYDDKLSVIYDMPEEMMKAKAIKLMLQPIMENAIIHGVESVKRNGLIRITASRQNEDMIISIEDNGAGICKEQLEEIQNLLNVDINELTKLTDKKASIGIFNIHMRLKLYFGNQYGLNIESREGMGTTVKLVMPYIVEGISNV